MAQPSLAPAPQYRKLPGHRRGILRGASVWIADDHLLSVKSYRFREEYKRFHLRDVQAIVVASAPRFHLSTRSLFIGALLTFAYFLRLASARFAFLTPALYILAGALVAAWLVISAAFSCRCRILTAVSLDELPSIYRTWTARKFLAKVEPGIAEVQGRVEGDWAVALETAIAARVPPIRAANVSERSGAAAPRTRTLISDLFLLTLFVYSAAMLLTLHSPVTLVLWLASALLLVELGAIAGVFVQQYRGTLRSGIPRLAIAALIKSGIIYYLGLLMVSVAASKNPSVDRAALMALPPYILLRQIDAYLHAVLGLVGTAIAFRRPFTD